MDPIESTSPTIDTNTTSIDQKSTSNVSEQDNKGAPDNQTQEVQNMIGEAQLELLKQMDSTKLAGMLHSTLAQNKILQADKARFGDIEKQLKEQEIKKKQELADSIADNSSAFIKFIENLEGPEAAKSADDVIRGGNVNFIESNPSLHELERQATLMSSVVCHGAAFFEHAEKNNKRYEELSNKVKRKKESDTFTQNFDQVMTPPSNKRPHYSGISTERFAPYTPPVDTQENNTKTQQSQQEESTSFGFNFDPRNRR